MYLVSLFTNMLDMLLCRINDLRPLLLSRLHNLMGYDFEMPKQWLIDNMNDSVFDLAYISNKL